jgi:hypothetical protein
MPYSNRRRHNPPSIPQTAYQTLIISCPNFDPIYKVILLENPNVWNLPPTKRRIFEKREEKEKGARIEKQQMWNLIWKAPCFKRREENEDEIGKLPGEILLKESKKGDHTFL